MSNSVRQFLRLPFVEKGKAKERKRVRTSGGKPRVWISLTLAVGLNISCISLLAQSRLEPVSSANTEESKRYGKAALLSLRLVPHQVTLWEVRASQRLLVLGTYSDRFERDVTLQSHFSISDPQVAKIDGGRILAVAEGETVLEAKVGDLVARARIRVAGLGHERPVIFEHEIVRVLTKHGCNTSDCHGSVKGKGGFKLSLNGLQPQTDYGWIVEGGDYQVLTAEPGGEQRPRIDLDVAENSLLLLKPTLAIPHGGGQRFPVGSPDYQTLLHWVRRGAPRQEDRANLKWERVEVFPSQVVLEPGGKHRLLITGYLSSGRQEDLSDHAYYISNNVEVARITREGRVEAVGEGETAVTVWVPGHNISARVGVIRNLIPDYPELLRRNLIDDHIFAKLKRFHLKPSESSSDVEFLRRVCLDVTGTLPPPERVRDFLASREPEKRDQLIEILLNSPEYVDYWTFRFADLFRVALYAAGFTPKSSHPYWEWIRDSIAQNKPYDQIARERIAAQGNSGPSRHFNTFSPPQDMMAEEIRVFLGRRLDCAQCHDHPFEMWSQDQYWGMAAFFGRMAGVRLSTSGPGVLVDLIGGGWGVTGEGGPTVHPRTGKTVQPTFFDGRVLPEDERTDPRRALAEWVTSHPGFARASVNRIWSYFFGRGIVNPVDDFRSANPPTHSELLNELARDFREHGYDLKHLIRRITQSRTYQLSGRQNGTNESDRINYSRALPRPLDAEILLDAISHVAGVPEIFERSSGAPGTEPPGTRAIQLKESDTYHSIFMNAYGRPDRLMVPERDGRPNLAQAMHMLAGPTYTRKLSQQGGRIDRLLKRRASDQEIIEEFSLTALSRYPNQEEQYELGKLIRQCSSRREAMEDLVWGLITSREFAYNH